MQLDKWKHFGVGLLVAALIYPVLGIWTAAAGATVAGIGKEIWDKHHQPEQTPELWDALATAAGVLPVAMFHWVLAS